MYKLQGRKEFQGMPISIEQKKGSVRHWHDPHNDTDGTTKMAYPYGYVRGTLGLDGDAVDVFLGPSEDSDKVFVVTQMKAPEFKAVDEQKVMLGFHSASEAKAAYLHHYDNPAFFGSMKQLSVASFKQQLASRKGKLIKHLCVSLVSASIPTANDPSDGGLVSKQESAIDVLKSLTSRMLVSITPRASREPVPTEQANTRVSHDPSRAFEAPAVAAEHVPTPDYASPTSPDFLTACVGCGYMHKSLGICPLCTQMKQLDRTAVPVWRR